MADIYPRDPSANRTTIIERRTGGGLMVAMIILIALVAAIAFFLFKREAREQRQTEAVVGAAMSLGDAAKEAGRSISEAAKRTQPKD